jgi:hypothetical protein
MIDPVPVPTPPITTPLVAALEHAWATIRQHHPEVPAAVLVVGAGTDGRRARLKYGHYSEARWQHGTMRMPEVLISGEGLARGAAATLGTLLHEAAHGLAAVRGIRDTSRQNRYHNQRFRALANELGIDVAQASVIGWSVTTIRPTTLGRYRDVVDALTAALVAFRTVEPTPVAARTASNNPLPCRCACPRNIRVARRVLDLGPILCGVCREPFLAEQ